jgi:hypothetical protein
MFVQVEKKSCLDFGGTAKVRMLRKMPGLAACSAALRAVSDWEIEAEDFNRRYFHSARTGNAERRKVET